MSHDTDFFQFAAVVLKSKGHWILPVSFRMWFGTDGKVASPNHQIGWHPIFNEYAEICVFPYIEVIGLLKLIGVELV